MALQINDPSPEEWRNKLPFYEQAIQVEGKNDVHTAIVFFRGLAAAPPPVPGSPNPPPVLPPPTTLEMARARGWLSYCYLSVAVDGWQIENWDSSADNGPDFADAAALKHEAKRLVDSIWTQTTYRDDYDVQWARAYQKLFQLQAGSSVPAPDFTAAGNMIDRILDDGPAEESAALAECADIYVYLGKLGKAEKTAKAALAAVVLEGGTAPDWYYWTLAWTQYSRAVVESNAAKKEKLLNKARKTLREMRRDLSERKFDFDALLLHAAIALKLDEFEECDEKLKRFRDKLQRKSKGAWDLAKETARNPFNTADPKAALVKTAWDTVCTDLFARPPLP